jgi:hypothetical protein
MSVSQPLSRCGQRIELIQAAAKPTGMQAYVDRWKAQLCSLSELEPGLSQVSEGRNAAATVSPKCRRSIAGRVVRWMDRLYEPRTQQARVDSDVIKTRRGIRAVAHIAAFERHPFECDALYEIAIVCKPFGMNASSGYQRVGD